MKRLLWLAALILALGVSAYFIHGSAHSEPVPAGFSRVVKVDDGDTIEVVVNGGSERIRLVGVDTPETVDPRRPVQCFGKEASKHTKQWLTGKAVKLVPDSVAGDRDKYHRLLRYVYLTDGTLYNQELITDGFGHEYTFQGQRYDHQLEFKRAEADARQHQRGLWSPSACNGNTKQPALP
jgi:micrococcal nuclease